MCYLEVEKHILDEGIITLRANSRPEHGVDVECFDLK